MSQTMHAAAYEHNGRTITAQAFYAIACNPRRSVAVEACAGAGKTWMLVSRIVRALLEGMGADGQLQVLPHEILAITFTKRAAGEMRERLYKWLAEFSQAAPDKLAQELALRGVSDGAGGPPTAQQCAALAQLYSRALDSGREVQIRTFHSWFAALLRSAPLALLQQLELPANYELLEDDARAVALVWRRFYAALLALPERRAEYEAVVYEHGRAQAEKALQAALGKRVEFALADAHGVLAGSVQHFVERFPALKGFDQPAQALFTDSAQSRWLGRARALGAEATKTPQKAAQMVLDAFGHGVDATTRLAVLRKAFFVAEEDRLTQHLRKFPVAQEAEAELAPLCAAQHQHQAWLHQQRMVALTRVLMAEYAAVKRENGWIDMNDVERAAQAMLSDPVLSGWVQQKLDAQVKHLLIDEFQDTNPLQWQALLSWLSGYGGSGGGSQPSVFIVGDPKQSIYRFRRAEPQVFKAAQQFVRTGLGGELLSCDHTRRNAPQVIAAVNAAMGHAARLDGYDGFRPHSTASADSGEVLSLPVIPREREAAAPQLDEPHWRDSLTTPREVPEETLRTLEARQAACWIARQVESGVPPSEVMVLSRKRAGLGPLNDALRALGIAAQVGEKTELIECCEVQDVVALLDVLVSPQHDLSLARALKSPIFSVTDADLVHLALQQRQQGALAPRPSASDAPQVYPPACPVSWYQLLQQPLAWPPGLQQVGATLARWKAWLDGLPPHDALQAIYQDGDLLARFAVAAPAPLRDTVLANLRALPGVALQQGGGRYATPYALVRALKAGGVQAPAAVNPQAVRLLTIHGAKGLEADAVLLLDTDAVERNAQTMGVLVDWPGEAAWPQKFVFLASDNHPPACAQDALAQERMARQREELNALYVAMTRARRVLAISAIAPHRETEGSWWLRMLSLATPVPGDALRPAATLATPATDAAFSLLELPALPARAQPAAAPVPPAEAPESARVGSAAHRLLQWESTSAHHVQLAASEFALAPEQSEQAAAMARNILQGAGAWAWDAQLLAWQANEVELVFQGKSLRLDRLVQLRDGGEWWVLDYKSAANPEWQTQALAQMREYCEAVQAIHAAAIVRAAFLTAHGELVLVN
jgi:ATP-dependent helicase/nuclease subunit A